MKNSNKRMDVGYAKPNKRLKEHASTLPHMITTCEETAKPRWKCKMDMFSGFGQIALNDRASELLPS